MSDLTRQARSHLDSYSRTARLVPALLILIGPVSLAICAIGPEWPVGTAIGTAAVALGVPIVIADWVRRRGQQLQVALWRSWGGNPVISALKEDGLIPTRRLQTLATATQLPLLERDHAEFDLALENAVRRLISATRSPERFPLVFAENRAYGFSRNMLAVRPFGIFLSALSLVGALALVVFSADRDALSMVGTALGALCAAGALIMWIWHPSEDRVRSAAADYRDRLLEMLDAGALESD